MRLTKTIALVALALAVVLALAACAGGGNSTQAPSAGSSPTGSKAARSSSDPQPPPSQATITGQIAKIAAGQGTSKVVTIKGATGSKLPEASGIVDESSTLIIQKTPNGGTVMMPLAALKVGQKASVWIAPPIQGTPPMGAADALEVQP